MDADITITDALALPAAELTWSFSRSGGPGGQHVNTTDTRVRLRFALSTTTVLTDAVKERVRDRCRQWLTQDGDLALTCDTHRSRHRNVEEARARLADGIRACLNPPIPRHKTRPTRGSQLRRAESKKNRSTIKRGRGRVNDE